MYRVLAGIWRELVELANRPETARNREQYRASYAENDFISRFVVHFTSLEFQKWTPILKAAGLDPHQLHGMEVFDQLGSFLKEQVSDYAAEDEALTSSPSRTPKPSRKKAVNQVAQTPPRAQTPQRGGMSSPRAYPVRQPMKDWHNTSLTRPCPIEGHGSHELSSCAKFLSMPAKERRSVSQLKVCYTCLSPLWMCREMSKSSLCVHERAFEGLICKQCAESVKGRRLSGMNILMCSHREHNKPSLDSIAPLLQQLIGLDRENKGSLVLSCIGQLCPTSLYQISKSRTPTLEPETCFDTTTGEVKVIDLEDKIPQPTDQPVYLVQLMKIGEVVFLVFFDTGANIHLVDGNFAELVKLQVVDQSPTTFRGAGDSEIKTEFGTYRLNVGPTAEGKYHEIIAHGVSPVTGKFPMFDFEKINQEIIDSGLIPKTTPLPRRVGGTPVQLLIGIKNVAAQPKLIHQMDNGLGIYQSPFSDIFGSRICYGGTHESLSEQVRGSNSLSEGLRTTLADVGVQIACTIEDVTAASCPPLEPEKTEFVQQDPDIVYPEPLHTMHNVVVVESTFMDQDKYRHMGIAATPVSGTCTHICEQGPEAQVCKAMIPIQRLKELADKDDVGELVTYRCSECASCQRCKESPRMKAWTTTLYDLLAGQ
ncbi:MAG: hypothetical protein AAFO91_03995, partial [Bacteroidota bacterium]